MPWAADVTGIDLQGILSGAFVAPEVFALRPDYRALLIAVDGIRPAAGDAASEALLARAEESARGAVVDAPVEEEPHVAAWREAYRAFGAKPQRTRNSLEALLRRAARDGLPRVNRLTDVYNAVCVLHRLPLGGEDLSAYQGPPRLTRATGAEPFDTVAGGQDVVEHPLPGEVVWGDEAGVTCRMWNWRQGRRTRLTDETASALFILDALDPMTDEQLQAAADDLLVHLREADPDLVVAQRLIAAG
ncbi:B3/B4 domain-containing protein [Microbacterium paludicola]|uniref:B3/B4 domain-containing protein n=1 Tax=Microbacterium paludicola TaxID=300019 RepID=UPI00337DC5EF